LVKRQGQIGWTTQNSKIIKPKRLSGTIEKHAVSNSIKKQEDEKYLLHLDNATFSEFLRTTQNALWSQRNL
jgi:hypothetical protein